MNTKSCLLDRLLLSVELTWKFLTKWRFYTKHNWRRRKDIRNLLLVNKIRQNYKTLDIIPLTLQLRFQLYYIPCKDLSIKYATKPNHQHQLYHYHLIHQIKACRLCDDHDQIRWDLSIWKRGQPQVDKTPCAIQRNRLILAATKIVELDRAYRYLYNALQLQRAATQKRTFNPK